MANIRFLCPECRTKLSIESERILMLVTCPECRKRIKPWGAELLDIKFLCPQCSQKIVIDSSAAGLQVICPSCANLISVPHEPAPAGPPPSPRFTPTITSAASQPVPTTTSSLLTEEEVAFLAGEPGSQ